MTRIFKEGDFYVFQDHDNLDRVNTLNVAQTTYDVKNGRHYFRQIRGERLSPIYSFLFADILNQHGLAYDDAEAFNTELAKPAESPRSHQVVHRLVSAASTNPTLIRTGPTRIFGAILTNDAAGPLYVKYYNKATAPTVGTDIPLLTIAVKTKETIDVDFGDEGILFEKGLGMGVTGAIPDADTTNVGVNEMFATTMLDNSDFFVESMLGVIQGAATVTGVIRKRVAILGTISGAATVTGVIHDRVQIEEGGAVINGVATLTGVLTAKGDLAAIVNNAAFVQGTLIDQP